MASVSTYLNFPRETETAFNFYKSVFGTEFSDGGFRRFGDMPPQEGTPPLPEEDKNLVLHVGLPILGGYMLMGSDAPESMGFSITMGTNSYICLAPDTRAETKSLFDALTDGGTIEMELQDMFWGSYFGSCIDKFGVKWMFDCVEPA